MSESGFKNVTLSDIANELQALGRLEESNNINLSKFLTS